MPRDVGVDSLDVSAADEVVFTFGSSLAFEGFDGSFFDSESGVLNRFLQINTDDSSKTTALGAGSQWRVEGEKRGCGRTESEAGIRVVPFRAKRANLRFVT